MDTNERLVAGHGRGEGPQRRTEAGPGARPRRNHFTKPISAGQHSNFTFFSIEFELINLWRWAGRELEDALRAGSSQKPLSFGIEKSTNFMLKRIFVSLGEGGAGVAAAEPSGGAARGAAGARPALALVDCRGAGAW